MKHIYIATLVILLILTISTTIIDARKVRGLRPVSEHYPVEPVHTLSPGNINQVYYNTGGAAVLTQKGVRLTPAVPGRTGWLWNEYPIENANFEVELKFELHSKPHFGGDGFAIWFVQGNSDPSHYTNPTAIEGPVMGMNDDFKGVGVVIDTYDNDGRRNNPAIFAVKNDGGHFNFRADQDFEGSMITDLYKGSHRCVNDLRNTNRPVEMVIKVINTALFVYINSHPSTGYRSCFSVQLNLGVDKNGDLINLKGSHLAITAQTGQVSDNVDIQSINVRYLKSTESAERATESFIANNYNDSWELWDFFQILALLGLAIYLVVITWRDYSTYKTSLSNHIDAVIICREINENVYNQYYLGLALHIGLIITMRWGPVLFLIPLTFIRTILHFKGYLLASPAMVAQFSAVYNGTGGKQGNGILGMSLTTRSMIALGSFGLLTFVLTLELIFGWTILY